MFNEKLMSLLGKSKGVAIYCQSTDYSLTNVGIILLDNNI